MRNTAFFFINSNLITLCFPQNFPFCKTGGSFGQSKLREAITRLIFYYLGWVITLSYRGESENTFPLSKVRNTLYLGSLLRKLTILHYNICRQEESSRGTQRKETRAPFFKKAISDKTDELCSHFQDLGKHQFLILAKIEPRSAFSAFAKRRQLKIVGIRLWLSIKLIAARLMPVLSASFSWDIPCSFRRRVNSSTIFSTKCSSSLSLIKREFDKVIYGLICNYSYVQ